MSRKHKNILIQWYRIHKCFQFIPENVYDCILRIRPDIEVLIDPDSFVATLQSMKQTTIHIPEGYDNQSSLNDQLAFGSYALMKVYCSLYNSLLTSSELECNDTLLSDYLTKNNISIQRVSLHYKLALSDCKVIAIAGDSASGKSTLMNYIQKIMPTDSSLCIETDSYHKWERNDAHWKDYTHLNPEANNLERMSEDLVRLKIGNTVALVNYDHSTGKFTQEKLTRGKPFILLCGLHTLFSKSILQNTDLKIFLDTEESLQTQWKIQRDTIERNHTVDKVLEAISKRKKDSEQFIHPQKQHANFIIQYRMEGEDVKVYVQLTPFLSHIVQPFSDFFASSVSSLQNGFLSYCLHSTLPSSSIFSFLKTLQSKLFYIPPLDTFEEGATGILQLIVFLILFYNEH